MPEIIVKPSGALRGSVRVSGSKNASLPIMAACLLTQGTNRLYNIPQLSDISTMCELLADSGAKISLTPEYIEINTENITNNLCLYNLVNRLRGSFLLAGPLLSRLGSVKIPLPGGCPIGSRPIDLHLKGFAALGADISQGHGFIEMSCNRLHGNHIYLDFPSVGATENILMAATLAEGLTVIENAATEPEIADLANFLNNCGAGVSGAGTDKITVEGAGELSAGRHTIIPDRIEAGTFMTAFAITGGRGEISGVNCEHIKPVAAKLSEMGVCVDFAESAIIIDATQPLHTADIKTMPFPGFPTDMQAPLSALLAVTAGTGIVVETVFENRFLHMGELSRMGAEIRIDGRTSVIKGVPSLTGACVNAMDLRGGAALTLAGMIAAGSTRISGIEHIRRGYEKFPEKLRGIGADIEVVE